MNEKSLFKYKKNMNILANNINLILTKLTRDINNFN